MIIDVTKRTSGGAEEVYYTPYGQAYAKNVEAAITSGSSYPMYRAATEMETLKLTGSAMFTNNYCFAGCTKLKTAIIAVANTMWANNSREFENDTGLETVEIGAVGVPVSTFNNSNIFAGCTQSGLTITLYVNAASLADLPSTISNAPWGATNATIVYRNSTTGGVLT